MPTTNKKLRRLFSVGAQTLAKGSLDWVFWPRSRAELRGLLKQHPGSTPQDILAVARQYKGCGFYKRLNPYQVESEFRRLIEWANQVQPRVVLEIGTAQGGTLLAWARIAKELLVSIDLWGGIHGGGYWPRKQKLYRETAFDRPQLKVVLIQADSQKPETKERAKNHLQGRPVDIMFVDGDHTLAGVTRDFELWRDLVRPGGYMVFHDIVVHPPEAQSDVDKFWQQLKRQGNCFEFVEDPKQGKAGIGIWQKPLS